MKVLNATRPGEAVELDDLDIELTEEDKKALKRGTDIGIVSSLPPVMDHLPPPKMKPPTEYRERKENAFKHWREENQFPCRVEDGVDVALRLGFDAGYDIGAIPVGPPKLSPQFINAKNRIAKLEKEKEEPITPKGYGELKVGMEGKLNGVPVVIRKITKKDVILRPLNRSIRDKDGLMVSFKEDKGYQPLATQGIEGKNPPNRGTHVNPPKGQGGR